MRLLLDENASARSFLERLRLAGHDAVTSTSAVGAGASDSEVTAYALAESRIVVTRDCDDFRSLYGRLTHHPGLLLIYGFGDKTLSTEALVIAIDNIANTYATANDLVLSLNDFYW